MGEGRDRPPDPRGGGRTLYRYTSPDEDSARWWDFPFRPGDIVVSTRSKSGTTWVQMICLLLVFGTRDLPGRLGALSPWLDWLVQAQGGGLRTAGGQTHRRVIKTHTPLDGVPLDQRVTYIVVGTPPARHGGLALPPRRQHRSPPHGRAHRATPGQAVRPAPRCTSGSLGFVDWEGDARAWLDTLPGALLHLSDAWARRHEPNVVLVHYDDLVTDLDGTMRRIAGLLGIPVDEERWPALVHAATFDAMRERDAARPTAPSAC